MTNTSKSYLITTTEISLFIGVLLALFTLAQGCALSKEDYKKGEAESPAIGNLLPVDLRCQYLVDPLGVDDPAPRFSWKLKASDPQLRGRIQTAYQVIVSTDPKKLSLDTANVWDSGRVISNEQLQIALPRGLVMSGLRYFWKVRAWDQENKPSAWSRLAYFETGLLRPDDWTGVWIHDGKSAPEKDEDYYKDDPAPLFRKEFGLIKTVRQARLYISGLGYYEAYLNGEKVGDHVLDPGWTTYSQRVLYAVHDVTHLLVEGQNALGVIVGNGWYNPLPLRMWGWLNLRDHLAVGRPRVIAQLNLEYEDGSVASISTDETWKQGQSPIVRNDVYLGEVYDARLEQPGWNEPGFDDEKWPFAIKANDDLGPLRAQMQPPIKVISTCIPVSVHEPSPGKFIFDMGHNFAGWVRLRVSGPAGTKVRLRYGELLYPDGTLNGMTAVCGQIKGPGAGGPGAPDIAFQEDTYILKGGGEETYTPRFTFHGFRYVEMTGYPGKPSLDALEGIVLCAAVEEAGSFRCSNPRFNRIQEMVCRTFRSNLFSVQSDCPAREKFGYGGDIVVTSEAMMFNFDMAAFYLKAIRDLGDAAQHTGVLTETAPYVCIANGGFGGKSSPPGWAIAHPLLQEQLLRYYGAQDTLEEQYEIGRQWLELLESHAVDCIIDRGISDHESVAPRPVPVTGTSFYYDNARLMAWLAKQNKQEEDALRFTRLANEIKVAFINSFFDPTTGKVHMGTQACQAAALYFDLLPPQGREVAFGFLLDLIENRDQGHLTTGIFGTKYLLQVLTDAGHADVAYKIVNQESFPGWGHMLEQGATTLWEHWRFSDNTYSHNHPMFGMVSEWFFKALGGIRPAYDANGFDGFLIQPNPVEDLTWARTSYDSVRGTLSTHWRLEDGRFLLDVRIPPNTIAQVRVPTKDGNEVYEGNMPAFRSDGVRLIQKEKSAILFEVGSGTYSFSTSDRQ